MRAVVAGMIKKASFYLSTIGDATGSDLFWKRVFDVAVSASILLVTLPLTAIAALAILLEDGGPVFSRRTLTGRHGLPFQMLRLRVLNVEAEAAAAIRARADAAWDLTLVGQFLQFCRIDEIPQLLSVIAGDMSIIGPKPLSPRVSTLWAQRLPLFANRHAVKPGLIGCARDSYPSGNSLAAVRGMLKHDLDYLARRSLAEDMAILFGTITDPNWLQSEDA